ncbi:MAG: class I SAM-dependent methyltransferase [Candidatus Nanohaloarchaea archaeon]|nr:class I SAM-dependent methyltransferase [Candidatus Nanohaloarchaea archaeon]
MSDDDMRDTVRRGYEDGRYHEEYREDYDVKEEEQELLDRFLDHVPDGGSLLDMGCGTGVPYDRFLVEQGYDVTGVDFTPKHVQQARENVPAATFIEADFTAFSPDTVFDGLLSLFAILHVPREEQEDVLEQFHGLVGSGAPLLVTLGLEPDQRATDQFAGAETVWSTYGREKNLELLQEAGFEIVSTAELQERMGMKEHLWVVARKS